MNEIVIFDMWGQRCETRFDPTSELDFETWIKRCVEKGYMYPIEVVLENGVVLKTEDELSALTSEK